MISFRRLLGLSATALLAFYCLAIPAFAEESAKADPAESPVGVLFKWLNFAIVFGAIAWLVGKHGGTFFRGNAKEISARIVEATAVKAEADRELSVVEAKMARLDQDVSDLRSEAQRNWATEAERLRASGAVEIEKIQQAARVELAAAERAAQQQVREIAASLAVEHAASVVASRMNAQVRAKMFQSFLGELGKGAK